MSSEGLAPLETASSINPRARPAATVSSGMGFRRGWYLRSCLLFLASWPVAFAVDRLNVGTGRLRGKHDHRDSGRAIRPWLVTCFTN